MIVIQLKDLQYTKAMVLIDVSRYLQKVYTNTTLMRLIIYLKSNNIDTTYVITVEGKVQTVQDVNIPAQ